MYVMIFFVIQEPNLLPHCLIKENVMLSQYINLAIAFFNQLALSQ